MPTNCAIRFATGDRSEWVIVRRDRHGEPDQVIHNLTELEELTKATETHDSPFQVAGQFLFLDKLWYIRYHYAPDEFGEVLWDLLSTPTKVEEELANILTIHNLRYWVIYSEDWVYDLRISEDNDWHVS